MSDAEDMAAQEAAPYPDGFALAVKPDEIDPYLCEHETDPTRCVCTHDWRIYWGNPPKVNKARATYIQ